MHILVLGSGSREHALAEKIAESPLAETVFLAPGNAGTHPLFPQVLVGSFEEIANSLKGNQIQVLVIGPEQYLVDGLVDYLQTQPGLEHLCIVGPDKACAALEGSKDFSKQVMLEAGIPTASARTFTVAQWPELETYLAQHPLPVVIKADGLAAGKGVAVCSTHAEAQAFAASVLKDQVFGAGNASVLVEEFLDGIEVSMFALCDGKNYQLLPEAKDYKRIFDGDQGPNTGGMGSVSPVPFVDDAFRQKVEDRVLKPLFKTLNQRGLSYTGFLFVGLMKVGDDPFVIEFNARMGDPETQTVMNRIEGDFLPALLAIRDQTLIQHPIRIRPEAVATVVLCAENYPEAPVKGDVISFEPDAQAKLYFAGVSGSDQGLRTSGGRVLSCTAVGNSPEKALEKVYRQVANVRFRGMRFRKDIGRDVWS